MKEALHRIGEVAERLALSLRTVRYYEEEGLARPSERSDGGFRLYSDADIERLAFIRRMKPLGFSVQQMRELLDARDRLVDRPQAGAADAEALERLSEFAAAAREKCEGLRAQLETAEQFAGQLQGELRRHRRRSRRERAGAQ